jgi:hypothetical protein
MAAPQKGHADWSSARGYYNGSVLIHSPRGLDSLMARGKLWGMQKLPSLDLSRVQIPLSGSNLDIQEFTVKELKDELLRRGNVDFSKWEVLVKLSPFILLLAMGILWKAGVTLECLLP